MALIPRGATARWVAVPGSDRRGHGQPLGPSRYIREYSYGAGGGAGGGNYSAPDINIPGFGGDGSGGTGDGGYQLPKYNLPGRDDARIEELRAKALNPMMRGLRNNLQASMVRGRISDNPYAESLRRGELLAGTGRGMESAMTGAHNTAMSQYAPEFAGKMQKAGAEYGAGVSRAGQMYAGGLQRGNLQFTAQTNAAMSRANMEHQARMAQLQADLKYQYA